MLTIRSAQIDVLERAFLSEHYPFWSRRLSARLPHLEEHELLTQIERALASARALGITNVRDLTAYFDLCADLGFDFDTRAECVRIAEWLRDARLSSPSRRLQLAAESGERIARIREQNRRKRDAFERR